MAAASQCHDTAYLHRSPNLPAGRATSRSALCSAPPSPRNTRVSFQGVDGKSDVFISHSLLPYLGPCIDSPISSLHIWPNLSSTPFSVDPTLELYILLCSVCSRESLARLAPNSLRQPNSTEKMGLTNFTIIVFLLVAQSLAVPFASLLQPRISPQNWSITGFRAFEAAPGPDGISDVSFGFSCAATNTTAQCSRSLPPGSDLSAVDPDHYYSCDNGNVGFEYGGNWLAIVLGDDTGNGYVLEPPRSSPLAIAALR